MGATHKQISEEQLAPVRPVRRGWWETALLLRSSRVTVARFLCFVVRVNKAGGILHSLSLSTRRARHAAATICFSEDRSDSESPQPAAAMAAALHRLLVVSYTDTNRPRWTHRPPSPLLQLDHTSRREHRRSLSAWTRIRSSAACASASLDAVHTASYSLRGTQRQV